MSAETSTDTYRTLSAPSEGEFKDRGSKFIAYATAVYDTDSFQDFLMSIKKLHPKSRHFCYAYRLGLTNDVFRTNDDGEPSGTAGKPILGQIDSFNLRNVGVVVIRYFGGTLLGTSGLINAYRESTKLAFENATIIEKTVEYIYRLTFDYAIMSQVMNAVKKLDLEMVQQDFGHIGKLDVAIRKSEIEKTLLQLKMYIADIREDQAAAMEQIEGLTIELVKNPKE